MAKKSSFSIASATLTFHGLITLEGNVCAMFRVLSPVRGYQDQPNAALPLSSLLILRGLAPMSGRNAEELLYAERAFREELPLIKQAEENGVALVKLAELDRPGRPLTTLKGYGFPFVV